MRFRPQYRKPSGYSVVSEVKIPEPLTHPKRGFRSDGRRLNKLNKYELVQNSIFTALWALRDENTVHNTEGRVEDRLDRTLA